MDVSVEQLTKLEPWRVNQGQPRSVLDPTWSAQEQAACDGDPHHEVLAGKVTGWWWCTKCGFCSNSVIPTHRTAKAPNDTLVEGLQLFYQKRKEQGIPESLAEAQAKFIVGVALKYALTTPPDQLTRFVEEHLIIR